MKNTYKALEIKEVDPSAYERAIVTKNIEDLPAGEVLVEVHYSSLNYKDALSATGNKGVTRNYPHTPGIDAAGIVVTSDDKGFAKGDEVIITGYDLGMNTFGGYGEYVRVPADWVVPLPKGLSLKESMTYGTAGFTAALSVYKLINSGVQPSDGQILVTGATGGVGSIAVSILSKLGYQVIAATGKAEQKELLQQLGAVDIINRSDLNDDSGRPMLKTKWAGVIDTVGGNTLATAIKTTQYGGSVTCCGNVSGHEVATSVYPFILRGVNLLGVDSVQCPMPLRKDLWTKLANDWKITFSEGSTKEVSLEELNTAIDMILQGKHVGRTIVNLGK